MAKKIKVAIWGLGRAGWGMHAGEIDRFPEMFEIVGCYDVLPERMARMAERYPGCKSYQNEDELLADSEIELVAIAIRSPEHVAAGIKALDAGKCVFTEKPMAMNYEEAMRFKAAADRHPGKLFCRQNRRFEAAFQHVREIINSGILGRIFEIKLCRHNYQRRNDWQSLKKCGGGQLNNWGPHLIDHALQFLNYDVESVWGDTQLCAAVGDAEDHFKAVIRGKNGLVVDIEVSGGVAIPAPVYAVYGTKGTLVAENESEFKIRRRNDAETTPAQPASGDTPPQEASFGSGDGIAWIEETVKCDPASGENVNSIYSHIYRALRENVPFPIKCAEAFEVVRISDMIKRSSLN